MSVPRKKQLWLRQDQIELLQEILWTFDQFIGADMDSTLNSSVLKCCGRFTRKRVTELRKQLTTLPEVT